MRHDNFESLILIPHTLIGVGLILCLIFVLLWAAFGTDYEAAVQSAEVEEGRKGSFSYSLTYTFTIGTEFHREESAVRRAVYDAYKTIEAEPEGSRTVTVRYFELGPFHFTTVKHSGLVGSTVLMLIVFACFWNGSMAAFYFQWCIKPSRLRALYENGVPVKGRLYSKDGSQIERQRGRRVSYSFKDSNGRDYSATLEVSDYDAWIAAKPPFDVTVLYRPDRPERSTLYEFGGYTLETIPEHSAL